MGEARPGLRAVPSLLCWAMARKPRPSNYDLLLRAMRERRPVAAVYHGLQREMCPHVLGRKRDRLHCLFYQHGGESSAGPVADGSPDNWRCIPVAELTELRLLDGPWHWGPPGHGGRQTCVDMVEETVGGREISPG